MSDPDGRALDTVDTSVAVVDGRVAMSADGEATLRVESPDYTLLDVGQTHATLRVSGEDYRATIELDGQQLDALRDALHAATPDTEGAP